MREEITRAVKDTLKRVVDSFAGVLSFDTDPSFTEEENVARIVDQSAVVCMVIGCVNPIPVLDLLVFTPIHTKMTLHIAKAKGLEISEERALDILREVVATVGLSVVAGGLASFVKLVPVVGWIVYAPIVYGATYGLGRTVSLYFDGLRSGRIPAADELKDLFTRELSKGKAHGATLRKEQIDQAYAELKRKVEERERAAKAKEEAPRGEERRERHTSANPLTPSKITIRERPVRRPTEPAAEEEPERPAEEKKQLDLGPTTQDPAAEPPVQPFLVRSVKTIGPATPAGGTDAAASRPNLVDELERLAKLRDLGALTPEEFDAAKKKLISG
jgi:uncharacterized protein (DUF697 family)